MIAALVRQLLCRAGRHDVIRCAGAEDHRWRHDGRRWVATLDRVPPLTPAARPSVDGAAREELDLPRPAARHRSTP